MCVCFRTKIVKIQKVLKRDYNLARQKRILRWGGGILPIIYYTGILRPEVAPFWASARERCSFFRLEEWERNSFIRPQVLGKGLSYWTAGIKKGQLV